jgi:hypothetical protein
VQKEVAQANKLQANGQFEDAKKLFIACSDCLVNISKETKDDHNFYQALLTQIQTLINKAEECT